MKRIKFLLQLIDGLWSVPLGFFVFFASGLLLSSIFGVATGQYDMAFIQPLFLAGTIVVGGSKEFHVLASSGEDTIVVCDGCNYAANIEADSGAIGGSGSKEFHVLASSGEDTIVVCDGCNYAANIENDIS